MPLRRVARDVQTNALLRNFSTADLRLRFKLLVQFNNMLSSTFKYISLSPARFRDSLGSLLAGSRSAIFRQVKMSWTFDVLNATAVEGNQPTIMIERLRLASRQEQSDTNALTAGGVAGIEDAVKNTAFGLAMQQLRGVDRALLRQRKPPGTEPHYSLKIVFQGENVEGLGGPYRQFFSDVVSELKDHSKLAGPDRIYAYFEIKIMKLPSSQKVAIGCQ